MTDNKYPFNMVIEKTNCATDDAWHGLRGKCITASNAGALWPCHEWMTPYKLYNMLKGLFTEDDISDKPQIIRGNHVEKYNAPPLIMASDLLSKEDKASLIHNDGDNRCFYHVAEHKIGATPDFIGDGFTIQVKSVYDKVWGKWNYGEKDAHGEWVIPDWIFIQATIEACLVCMHGGYDLSKFRCYVLPICFGAGLDAPLMEIKLEPSIFAKFLQEAGLFWNDVENDIEPPIDLGKDGETIAKIYGTPTGEVLDFSNDEEVIAKVKRANELNAILKPNKDELDGVKTYLRYKMKGAEMASLGGGLMIKNSVSATGTRRLTIPKVDVSINDAHATDKIGEEPVKVKELDY